MSKVSIAVLFGGQSSEHEVSLLSASNVLRAIPKTPYRIFPIGIKKDGSLLLYQHQQTSKYILDADDPKKIRLSLYGEPVSFCFGSSRKLFFLKTKKNGPRIDVIFPVLHGAFGEDGTIQGLAQLLGIPCVGASVLGSAIGIDKDVTKRLLRDAGIPIADFLVFRRSERQLIRYRSITAILGCPFFLKPAAAGSSVGVHKIKTQKQFSAAVNDAFLYSDKIIFEQFIDGVEIECSVLGNEKPLVSLPGTIVPTHEFYSYEAKYLDDHGAEFQIPAALPKPLIKHIQTISLNVFKILSCSGMARVDGFYTKDGKFLLNEINTIPGFTNISMYPKLWEVSGLMYSQLLDRLIQLALH